MIDETRDDLVDRIRALSRPLQPISSGAYSSLRPLVGIRAVLFDIYGTLVVSASGDIGTAGACDSMQAFREALAAAGIATASVGQDERGPELLAELIRVDHLEAKSKGVEYPEVDILSVWRRTLQAMAAPGAGGQIPEQRLSALATEYECRVNPVWPMPGARDCLQALAGAGLVLGIVSNAQFYTLPMLQALLGESLQRLSFSPELCAFSYRLREAKPSGAMFAGVLRTLCATRGIAPQHVLYVGNDRLKDIWPAFQAGCHTALFAGDARSLRLREDDPRCAGVQADIVVTDLQQVVEAVLGGH
jgi:putative hydrolase of the HAD superfamily